MAYDYKKYMEQMGNVTADQKEIIKQYLEKQCEQDEALKAVYNPDKINECYDFITSCARQIATGSKACLEDAVVFKMARDFFLGDVPQKEEKKKEADKTEAMPEDKAEGGTEAQDEEVLETCYDPDNDPDAEDVVQVESCAMPEDVARDMKKDAAQKAEDTVIPDEVKYDENGNGMLFEF